MQKSNLMCVCGLTVNICTYQIRSNFSKHLLKLVEKKKYGICKKVFDTEKKRIDHIKDELHDFEINCRSTFCTI